MLILGQVSYAPQGPKIRKIIFNNPGAINVITRWFWSHRSSLGSRWLKPGLFCGQNEQNFYYHACSGWHRYGFRPFIFINKMSVDSRTIAGCRWLKACPQLQNSTRYTFFHTVYTFHFTLLQPIRFRKMLLKGLGTKKKSSENQILTGSHSQ